MSPRDELEPHPALGLDEDPKGRGPSYWRGHADGRLAERAGIPDLAALTARDTLAAAIETVQAPSATHAVEVYAGTPKTVREALCIARIGLTVLSRGGLGFDADQLARHREVLDGLVRGVDLHRPLGIGGEHDDLHTGTCGCEDGDNRRPWSITIAQPAPVIEVGQTITTAAELESCLLGAVLASSYQGGRVARRVESSPILCQTWSVTGLAGVLCSPEHTKLLPARVLDLGGGP